MVEVPRPLGLMQDNIVGCFMCPQMLPIQQLTEIC